MDALFPVSVDWQEFSLLFKEPIPTLQQITSFNVVRSLWYNAMFVERNIHENSIKIPYKYMMELPEFLRDYIPAHLIPHLIKKSMHKLLSEINLWEVYNTRLWLPDLETKISRGDLKYLVWRFDGKIDYPQTARKLLLLDSLSQMDKFSIMSRYCLEDEFEKFTINKELKTVLASVIRQRRPRLPFYWICRLRKKLRRMRFRPNFASLESLMVQKMGPENIYAVEYFWDRLSEHDQVAEAVILFKNPFLVEQLQKRLLSKMNEFQLAQIFFEIPVEIIVNFWDKGRLKEPELAFSIWTRIKHLISDEQYGDLWDKVLPLAGSNSERSFPLIIKLWDTAYDHQKRFILDEENGGICLEHLFSRYSFSASKMLQLLHAMVSYSSPSYRKQFILEKGVKLMVRFHSDDLRPFFTTSSEDSYLEADRVIKLCLLDDNDVIEFKERIMKSTEAVRLCRIAFSEGFFDNITKFVQFYAPGISLLNDFKKLILDPNEFKPRPNFRFKNWIGVEKLVDDVYPDAQLAKNMKRQLILAAGTRSHYDSVDSTNTDGLRSLINISSQFLSDEEMVVVKESLLNVVRKKVMKLDFWKSFDGTYWQEFTSFCFDGEEKINEFKASIPIDEIFGTKLESLISRYAYDENCIVNLISVTDNFLKWFLVEPEDLKKFKLRRIFEFNGLEIIERSIPRLKNESVKTLLLWFLDNDQEQICKFKTEFSDRVVSQMI